jgi:hypothetical protein
MDAGKAGGKEQHSKTAQETSKWKFPVLFCCEAEFW